MTTATGHEVACLDDARLAPTSTGRGWETRPVVIP
jgi:hypothetical protein